MDAPRQTSSHSVRNLTRARALPGNAIDTRLSDVTAQRANQYIHAAIRKPTKEGGALHTAPDLVLIAANTGS
jgi:hypothetical protein